MIVPAVPPLLRHVDPAGHRDLELDALISLNLNVAGVHLVLGSLVELQFVESRRQGNLGIACAVELNRPGIGIFYAPG